MIRLRATTRRAFTLFELLVVVGIILVLLILTVPSFAGLVKSNNFSAAVNQLAGTLEAARERAIARNSQTAVAVFFDLGEKGEHRTRLLILDEAGRGAMAFRPEPDSGGQYATVFHPAANTTPVVLPPGIMIFGLSRHHFLPDGDSPYDDLLSGSGLFRDRVISFGDDNEDERNAVTAGWYVGSVFADPDDGNVFVNPWLAPRNDPRVYMDPEQGGRDIDAPIRDVTEIAIEDLWDLLREPAPDPIPGFDTTPEDAVRYMRNAQSFMIRFSPNGSIIATSADTTQTDQAGYAYLEFPDNPVANDPSAPAMTGLAFDSPSRFDPEAAPRDQTQITPPPFDYSSAGVNPEVALRAVTRLAVVDLQDLQRGTGVSKPWLLRPAITDMMHQAPWPDAYVPGDVEPISSGDEELNALVRDVSNWIDENAVLLDFSRYSGRVMRR